VPGKEAQKSRPGGLHLRGILKGGDRSRGGSIVKVAGLCTKRGEKKGKEINCKGRKNATGKKKKEGGGNGRGLFDEERQNMI